MKQRPATGQAQIRLFVCIEIPATIQHRLEHLQVQLRAVDTPVSWVKSTNIHLTLKFLGNVAESRVTRVVEAVKRTAGRTWPFSINISGTGCFPSARKPRILWVGIRNVPDSLSDLHTALEHNLLAEGIPREVKPFRPHLTIGRPRSPRNSEQLAGLLAALDFAPESFAANEITLMRSDLNPTGSIYTALYRAGFRAPE